MVTQPSFQDFEDSVTTIDAHYVRPGLAAIHLLVEGDRALVDVRVLDHLIVAGSAILSFAERGLL